MLRSAHCACRQANIRRDVGVVMGEQKKRGYVMQDVPRGFASACRRACLSVDVGCLFAESPLYHFNAPIGYDNCSIVYVLDTHENSMAEFVRACETMDHNARRLQTRQNFLRSFSISGGSGKRRNIYNCDSTSLRWIIKKCRNVCVTIKREKKRKSEYGEKYDCYSRR